jgi:hypothetical protein
MTPHDELSAAVEPRHMQKAFAFFHTHSLPTVGELAQLLADAEAALRAENERLRRLLEEMGDLGTVYVAPEHWDYPGMGGPPEIKDYEQVDLAAILLFSTSSEEAKSNTQNAPKPAKTPVGLENRPVAPKTDAAMSVRAAADGGSGK